MNGITNPRKARKKAANPGTGLTGMADCRAIRENAKRRGGYPFGHTRKRAYQAENELKAKK